MPRFFDTFERQDQLRAIATSWLGTPFRKWQRVKGAGVDCVQLAGAIYIEAGVLDAFEPGHYTMDGGDHLETSPVLEWLRACDRFAELNVGEQMTGDLLCFRMNRLPHHVGILLEPMGDFIHCAKFLKDGTRINSTVDATWGDRLANVFRPLTP